VYPRDIVILMLAKDAGIRVRVDKKLRGAFAEACRAQGLFGILCLGMQNGTKTVYKETCS
jgi:hypothetical protein